MRRELKDISEEEILHFLGYGDAVPDEQTLHALNNVLLAWFIVVQ